MKYRLALCAIMKNEQKNVLEWVAYHRVIGIDHFYIYDNDNNSGMDQILKKYIESDIVTLIKFPGQVQQLPAYNDCINKFKEESKYIGFFDADEFLVPVEDVNVADLVDRIIEGYRINDLQVAGLSVKWAIYGWGGHITRPEGLVIENYLYKENGEMDKHVKAIVDPRKVDRFVNPHYCIFQDNKFYSVDEEGKKVSGPFLTHNRRNKIRLNHYYYKSEEDFKGRIQRKRSDLLQTDQDMISRINKELPSLHESDKEFDDMMLRYVTRVKQEISNYC